MSDPEDYVREKEWLDVMYGLEAEVERLTSERRQLERVLHELGIRYEFTQDGVRFTTAARVRALLPKEEQDECLRNGA